MKTALWRACCVLLILLLFLLPLAAEKPLLCVYTEYRPANFLDTNGSHKGFFVDISRELFEKRVGIQVEFKVFPWARCQTMLERGEADFIMTIPTEERLRYSVRVPTPIWMKQYRIVALRNDPRMNVIVSVRSRESLASANFTVLSYLGNNWSKERLEAFGISVINAPTVDGMYNMLLAKRGDLIVEDTLLAQTYIETHGLYDRMVIVGGIIDESPFHILIGKNSPLMESFANISEALREMQEDGTIQRITDDYYKE